ncbi:MAG: DUF2946 family protein, partial [Betaproteobacteria bacterium]|nr:DUF2946 family protein [Betaproteobacteria bacterium]
MDEAVLKAMARWPDIPAVFGWLLLDPRGGWRLVQRDAPNFDPIVHKRGEPITSPSIIDFIGRNYARDDKGRWFWQNGPQRVFVELEAAPLIFRVLESANTPTSKQLVTHTGYRVERIKDPCVDLHGRFYLATEHGPGMIHDLDLAQLELEASHDDAGSLTWRWQSHRQVQTAY